MFGEEVLDFDFVLLDDGLVEVARVEQAAVGLRLALASLADDLVEVLVLLGHQLQILVIIVI